LTNKGEGIEEKKGGEKKEKKNLHKVTLSVKTRFTFTNCTRGVGLIIIS
jgi:hypothetical protein